VKRYEKMNARAYMLLDIVDRSCEDAVQILRSRAEVILADGLEGYPNVIAVVEAVDRQSLAEAIMPTLESIDGVTENIQLLVTRKGFNVCLQENALPFWLRTILKTPNSRNHCER
jgi:hypothetical protein